MELYIGKYQKKEVKWKKRKTNDSLWQQPSKALDELLLENLC